MKVKELIAELQKLDQERGIWISYDGFNRSEKSYTKGLYDPIPNRTVKNKVVRYLMEEICYDFAKDGDYLIEVG